MQQKCSGKYEDVQSSWKAYTLQPIGTKLQSANIIAMNGSWDFATLKVFHAVATYSHTAVKLT